MSFLFPAFLLGAVAVAVPIVLHLMRREVTRRVAFSDLRFVRRVTTAQTQRRRLRELVLLALRVTALLLLAAVFARPYLDSGARDETMATVIAVDRSFSMDAPGRLDAAKRLAAAVIDETPSTHAIGLVAFDHRGRVEAGLGADRRPIRRRLAAVTAGLGATRYTAALRTAVELMDDRAGRIVLVTDLQSAGWRDGRTVDVPDGIDVEVRAVEPVTANVAVLSVRPGATTTRVALLNTGAPREVTVTARAEAGPLAATVAILPRGVTEVDLGVVPPPTGMLEVEVDDDIGFAADNLRVVSLEPPAPMRVAIAGDSTRSFYLWRALEVGRDESDGPGVANAPTFDVVRLTDAIAADLSSRAVVVVDETAGLDRGMRRRLVERLEAGGGMLVVAGPRLDPALVRDLSGPDRPLRLEPASARPESGLLVTDPRHPVFRAWRGSLGALGQAHIRETRQLTADGARVLATFADGSAALAELEVGRGRLMVVASDLNGDWNDLPRRPAFVPLVHELVRYLAGPGVDRGEITVDDLPPGPSAQIGVVTLPDTGERVVVNVDTGESDPAVLADPGAMVSTTERPPVPAGAEAPPAGDQLEAEQGLWWVALLVVGGLLVVESWLGRNMI